MEGIEANLNNCSQRSQNMKDVSVQARVGPLSTGELWTAAANSKMAKYRFA